MKKDGIINGERTKKKTLSLMDFQKTRVISSPASYA